MPSDRQYKEQAARVIARANATDPRSDGWLEPELRPEIQRADGVGFVQCWVVVPDSAFDTDSDATGQKGT